MLREEHVDDLNFANPQGINRMECKDFTAKTWHTRHINGTKGEQSNCY